ncbi:hypothetical protein Tco_0554013 [Tanacetum coccineum]
MLKMTIPSHLSFGLFSHFSPTPRFLLYLAPPGVNPRTFDPNISTVEPVHLNRDGTFMCFNFNQINDFPDFEDSRALVWGIHSSTLRTMCSFSMGESIDLIIPATVASFDTSDTKNDTLAIPRPLIGYTDVENIVRLRSKHHKAVIDQGMTLDHGERVESLEASQNQYKYKRISYRKREED